MSDITNSRIVIAQAIAIADALDGIGEYENAEELDRFVEEAFQYSDLTKQAGFVTNWLKRLKGKMRGWFTKEYKTVYEAAVLAQKELEERVGAINAQLKEIKRDVKSHELEGWRAKVISMPGMNNKDLLYDYDSVHRSFLATQLPSKPGDTKEKKTIDDMLESSQWAQLDRGHPGSMELHPDGKLRFSAVTFAKLLKGHHIRTFPKEDGYLVGFNTVGWGGLPLRLQYGLLSHYGSKSDIGAMRFSLTKSDDGKHVIMKKVKSVVVKKEDSKGEVKEDVNKEKIKEKPTQAPRKKTPRRAPKKKAPKAQEPEAQFEQPSAEKLQMFKKLRQEQGIEYVKNKADGAIHAVKDFNPTEHEHVTDEIEDAADRAELVKQIQEKRSSANFILSKRAEHI